MLPTRICLGRTAQSVLSPQVPGLHGERPDPIFYLATLAGGQQTAREEGNVREQFAANVFDLEMRCTRVRTGSDRRAQRGYLPQQAVQQPPHYERALGDNEGVETRPQASAGIQWTRHVGATREITRTSWTCAGDEQPAWTNCQSLQFLRAGILLTASFGRCSAPLEKSH